MCSIFQLVEGYTLPFEMLHNAMHNNEHGYGILLRDKTTKKIELVEKLTEEPEVEDVYKLLKDNEHLERWVHLRNTSVGAVNKDNVQPFHVYSSKKRDVYWMHNGQIPPIAYEKIDRIKDHLIHDMKTGVDSDSRLYAFTKIQPFINRFKGENGFGDIHDPFFIDHFEKQWQKHWGRSVFVSSDQGFLAMNIGDWETIEDTTGGKFLASNDTYFNKIIRGKLFKAQEEERVRKEKEEEAKKPKNALVVVGKPGPGEIGRLTPETFNQSYFLDSEFENAFTEFDLFDEEVYIQLAMLSHAEIKNAMIKFPESFALLFMSLTDAYKQSIDKLDETSRRLRDEVKEKEVHVG